MRMHRAPAGRRVGFTLIELMVVVGIIALLVALLTSAIYAAIQKVDEVNARNEITGLSNALTQFQTDFKVTKPVPSRLYLDESGVYAPQVPPGSPGAWPSFASLTPAQQAALIQLAADSKAYLQSVWPRAPLAMDWNLNGKVDIPYVLEGEQCLVYFLTGPIVNDVPTGFSADPNNPLKQGGPRKGPYFQFVTARIGVLPVLSATGGVPQWPVYYDSYSGSYPTVPVANRTAPPSPGDQPYAYFSCGTRSNGYNGPNGPYAALGTDCGALAGKPIPYAQNSAAPYQYYKPDTFQILCAGKNRLYGPGGYWVPSMGAAGMSGLTPTAKDGVDDLANFYDAKLGVVQ